jgi:alpha-beta hydrolase superfamily lysophospholipase
MVAERDVFWASRTAVANARAAMPDCETVVVQGARHLPAVEKQREMLDCALGFFRERVLLKEA